MDMYSTFLNQNSKVMSSYWQSTFLYFVSFQKRINETKKTDTTGVLQFSKMLQNLPLLHQSCIDLSHRVGVRMSALKQKKKKQKKKHINDILDACVPQNEDSKDASLVATAASLTVAPPQTLKQSLFRLLRKKNPRLSIKRVSIKSIAWKKKKEKN